jgi:hypothetical protein
MTIKANPVSKCLDKKLVIFGFEVPDLLAVFIVLSLLNLIFGQSNFKLLLVWMPSLALALLLRLGKRGKPDNHLVHWLRYQIRPGIWSAFAESDAWQPLPQTRKGEAHGTKRPD